jgi:two-component system NtrC family sensor kinase
MKLPFRIRILLGFALVVGITATVSTLIGFSFISRTVMKEAMLRVEMDVGAAWSAYEDEKNRLQIVVGMASQRETLRDPLRGRASEALAAELDGLRRKYDLDFLTLVRRDGTVVARARPPFARGDRVSGNLVVEGALAGDASNGTILLEAAELRRESEDLAERAYVPLIHTERALPADRQAEARGMVLAAAIPILDAGEQVLGALYGGILLNRKFSLVDRIRNLVFGEMMYRGKPVGTVTLFLGDVRVATNVMLDAGTRALGTRVSEEVYHRVLEGGRRFADRAFVVNDWYLSAYDPIRDPGGNVIGIIYVGLLEKKYLEYKASLAGQYLGLSLLSLLLSVAVALYLSSGYRRPVLQLVRGTRRLSAGDLDARVQVGRASREMTELGDAFNSMAASLQRDRQEIERTTAELERAYKEAAERNRAYLEMLGFVTHELKSPLASIVFAIGSLREGILGRLTDEQGSVLKAAAGSADYLQSTIANYLNLSRIEEGELRLRPARVSFLDEVIQPLVDRFAELAADRRMRIETEVPADLTAICDKDLVSSVFQNLLSNALKYGCEGGLVRIRGGSVASPGTELRFSVWNEGPGFDPQAADRLFRKFSRLGELGDATKTGTGLGLFVARNIVEKHGGHMSAASEPGKWAEFVFTLAATPSESRTLG